MRKTVNRIVVVHALSTWCSRILNHRWKHLLQIKTGILLLITLTVFPQFGGSQAVLSTEMEINGIQVFEDLKDARKFYYAPGELHLHHDSDGQPTFKLIQMRYTGTGVTGNQGEKRFTNIVQFKVVMHQYDSKALKKAKKELPPKSELRPLSISDVQADLIAPFEGKYKTIGQGVFDNEAKAKGRKSAFWQERTVTVRLDNHEAQLLWDMVEKGQIAMSVSYAYYGDLINDTVIDVYSETDSLYTELQKIKEEIEKRDTMTTTTLVHADAFNIEVNVKAYPEVLVQKDLNNGMPPAYPALQVACYDFYNDLRSDLLMKTIEFQAFGLNDNQVGLRPMKFLGVKKDIHTQQVRFPFAVDMTRPLRYKIKEFIMDGEIEDKGWQTVSSWNGILDITSQSEDLTAVRRHIEFEADLEEMKASSIMRYDVMIEYQYLGYLFNEKLSFTPDDNLPIQAHSILSDINTDIKYSITKVTEERRSFTRKRVVAIDDYVFLNMEN